MASNPPPKTAQQALILHTFRVKVAASLPSYKWGFSLPSGSVLQALDVGGRAVPHPKGPRNQIMGW